MELDEHTGQDISRLRAMAAFDAFSDAELERLVRVAHHTVRSDPWPLIYERTPSDSCFILLSGEVGVYIGRDPIAMLGPGEVIGESVLCKGKLRSATVTTTGPAEVLRIERKDLAVLLREMPALRDAMAATVRRHVPVPLPAKPKPKRSVLNAPLPTDLVERFEHAAETSGVSYTVALKDALSQWIDHHGAA